MSDWNDTPPAKAGTYWVKGRTSGEEWPMRLYEDGAFEGHPSEVKFGHRIPTADELAELPGLIMLYGEAEWFAAKDTSEKSVDAKAAESLLAKINAILGVADDSGED